MSNLQRMFVRLLAGSMILLMVPLWAIGQSSSAASSSSSSSSSSPTPVSPVSNPCTPRFAAGSVITNPPALFSSNGVLSVQFSYQTTTDSAGRTLFCFMTPSGLQEPTLHVNPGDTLNITVTNNTPSSATEEVYNSQFSPTCGSANMTSSSVNIHFHGTNTTPQCHGDNVVKTLIDSGQTFQYSVKFPTNEPPGLYWYHGHVHGIAEASVQGGAAGALVVDGLQNVQPAVAGLRHRILVVRDQPTLQGLGESSPPVNSNVETPNLDLSVNYVPGNAMTNTTTGVTTFTPGIMHMFSGETQLWRICNCTSDTILDIQLQFNGTPQTFQIVGIDGVPVNSQDGTQPGSTISATDYLIPTAGRVEILVTAPTSSSTTAQLVTNFISTGPLGDEDPTRPLFNIELLGESSSVSGQDTDNDEYMPDNSLPASTGLNTNQQMFAGVSGQTPSTTRSLNFQEESNGSAFFMNVVGQPAATGPNIAYDANHPPAIVTTQGAVEQWTVQNQAMENHEFHMHQIHFLVQSQQNFQANGSTPVAAMNGQFADMIQVPFWNGNSSTAFPQVVLLMDFRGMDVGSFVFHCHILGHEDRGMMQIMEVQPASSGGSSSSKMNAPKNNKTPVAARKKSTPSPATKPETVDHSVTTGAGAGGGMF